MKVDCCLVTNLHLQKARRAMILTCAETSHLNTSFLLRGSVEEIETAFGIEQVVEEEEDGTGHLHSKVGQREKT